MNQWVYWSLTGMRMRGHIQDHGWLIWISVTKKTIPVRVMTHLIDTTSWGFPAQVAVISMEESSSSAIAYCLHSFMEGDLWILHISEFFPWLLNFLIFLSLKRPSHPSRRVFQLRGNIDVISFYILIVDMSSHCLPNAALSSPCPFSYQWFSSSSSALGTGIMYVDI